MNATTEQSIRKSIQKTVSRVGARAYLSVDQENLVATVWTKILLNTIDYDLGGNFENNKFTVPVTGLYDIRANIDFDNIQANKTYAVAVYINGTISIHNYAHTGVATDELNCLTSDKLFLTVTDYLELYGLSLAAVDTVDVGSGIYHTYLTINLSSKEGIRQ